VKDLEIRDKLVEAANGQNSWTSTNNYCGMFTESERIIPVDSALTLLTIHCSVFHDTGSHKAWSGNCWLGAYDEVKIKEI
jgi:hypothetical protein